MEQSEVIYSTGTVRIMDIPKPVETLIIADSLRIPVYKKPKWLHRVMMKMLLGMEYKSN